MPYSVGRFGTPIDFSICGGFDRGFHITEENNKKNKWQIQQPDYR